MLAGLCEYGRGSQQRTAQIIANTIAENGGEIKLDKFMREHICGFDSEAHAS